MKSMSALLEALKQTQNDSKLDLSDAEPDAAAMDKPEEETSEPDPEAIVDVLKTNFPKTYQKCVSMVPADDEEAEMPEDMSDAA